MSTWSRLVEPPEQGQVEEGRLVEEQAALRRVATVVARGVSSAEVFASVAKEVAQGADPGGGSGLLGLKDRAEAIGDSMSLQSLPGSGTSLHVELPLDDVNRS